MGPAFAEAPADKAWGMENGISYFTIFAIINNSLNNAVKKTTIVDLHHLPVYYAAGITGTE
jgi:hypothetical protein